MKTVLLTALAALIETVRRYWPQILAYLAGQKHARELNQRQRDRARRTSEEIRDEVDRKSDDDVRRASRRWMRDVE